MARKDCKVTPAQINACLNCTLKKCKENSPGCELKKIIAKERKERKVTK